LAATIPLNPDSSRTIEIDRAGVFAREWPIYAVLLSSVSIVVGLIWDISWHRTIGRDTFWSPPHVIEQIGAIVSGLSCGFVALKTTFAGTEEEKARSVRFWKFFLAPLGAWVCIWGTIMMVTSAPFDNWWHNAYGLDVKIISPPHLVLASGMIAIQLGAMFMALGAQNRARSERDRRRLAILFSLAAAVIIEMATVMITEDASYANTMHGSAFYRITAMVLPLFMVAFARASRLSWPATRIAIVYMLITMLAIWVLQLFPAQAKLAPIYNPVTRMVPPAFPLLLFAPAIAIDLLIKRKTNEWILSVMIGVAFVATMLAIHWFWAEFMLSPAARNFFFGADQWDYSSRPGPWRYQWWNLDVDRSGSWSPAKFAKGLLTAVVIASVTSRVGLAWGRGMSRIQR
jgi:hypothetical protein